MLLYFDVIQLLFMKPYHLEKDYERVNLNFDNRIYMNIFINIAFFWNNNSDL